MKQTDVCYMALINPKNHYENHEFKFCEYEYFFYHRLEPGHVAQSVGHLTRKSGVLGSILGLATYFRFSFCFFKKGSCQLLAEVCAQLHWLTV